MKLKKILPWPPQYCTRVLYTVQYTILLPYSPPAVFVFAWVVSFFHTNYLSRRKGPLWLPWHPEKWVAFHALLSYDDNLADLTKTVLPESKVMPARCDAMRDVWQNSEHFTLLSCGESARFQNKIITNGSFLGRSTQYVAKLGMHRKLIWSAIAGVGKLRDCKFKLLVKIIFVNNNNK